MDNYDILIDELKDIVKTYKGTNTELFMNQLIENNDILNKEKLEMLSNFSTITQRLQARMFILKK